jgi:hypothetical protein
MTREELLQHLAAITPQPVDHLATAFGNPDAVGVAVAAPRGNDHWAISLLTQTGISSVREQRFLDFIIPRLTGLLLNATIDCTDGGHWQWSPEHHCWFSVITNVRAWIPSHLTRRNAA